MGETDRRQEVKLTAQFKNILPSWFGEMLWPLLSAARLSAALSMRTERLHLTLVQYPHQISAREIESIDC